MAMAPPRSSSSPSVNGSTPLSERLYSTRFSYVDCQRSIVKGTNSFIAPRVECGPAFNFALCREQPCRCPEKTIILYPRYPQRAHLLFHSGYSNGPRALQKAPKCKVES